MDKPCHVRIAYYFKLVPCTGFNVSLKMCNISDSFISKDNCSIHVLFSEKKDFENRSLLIKGTKSELFRRRLYVSV